ncbi:hypothetical protein niasHT_034532 [Heterodera trifolii]|uniref:Uncharacterized protein n=1 Tax=Heterodera trifolii TaxID=157864 RepID=A0ABD2I399_9BILA
MLEKVLSEYQKASEVAQDISSEAEIKLSWGVSASSILDAYIKLMKKRELDEYRKFYDDNGKDEQLDKLLEKYQKISEKMEKFINDYLQIKLMQSGMRNALFTKAMKSVGNLAETITNVKDDLEKRKHSVQLMKKGEE